MSIITRRLQYKALLKGVRGIHATYPVQSDALDRWLFKINGYNKYGLLKDDFEPPYGEHTAEAVRRLPEEMQMERIYRSIRATQCDVNHTILPPEEWTKFEDNHHYLQPYIKEIIEEKEERANWDANH